LQCSSEFKTLKSSEGGWLHPTKTITDLPARRAVRLMIGVDKREIIHDDATRYSMKLWSSSPRRFRPYLPRVGILILAGR
jgi:hypothetical protein